MLINNVIDPPILVGNYQQSLEQLPLQDDEMLIYEQFANNNNLKVGDMKVGDKYNIINHTFTIRGFVTSRNSAFIGNNITGIIDPKIKTVAFVNSNTMININNDFKQFIDRNIQKNSFNPVYPERGLNSWLYNILHQQLVYDHHYQNLNNGINFAYVASILTNDDYWWRPYNENAIFFLNERIKLTQNVATIFLTLIFIVASIIILMIVWKMIYHNHKLIAVLNNNEVSELEPFLKVIEYVTPVGSTFGYKVIGFKLLTLKLLFLKIFSLALWLWHRIYICNSIVSCNWFLPLLVWQYQYLLVIFLLIVIIYI